MSDLDNPALALAIPLNDIYERFVCPVCLEIATDTYMTPCGHNFCGECVREWLNLHHSCPMCNAEITVDGLVKNHHFDELLSLLQAAKERAAKEAVHSLLDGEDGPGKGSPSGSPSPSPDGQVDARSPIRAVFAKHAQRSLLAYQQYYEELQQSRRQRLEDVAVRYTEQVETLRARRRQEKQRAQQQTDELEQPPVLQRSASQEEAEFLRRQFDLEREMIEERFERSVSLLVQSYDEFMSQFAPATPFLVPVTVGVTVEPPPAAASASAASAFVNPKRFLDVRLRSTDTLAVDLIDRIRDKAKDTGDPVTSTRAEALAFFFQSEGAGGGEQTELDPNAPVCELQLQQGGQIIVRLLAADALEFESSKPARCFSADFVKGEDMRVDYFHCETCNLNWICSECAKVCHKGHPVTPYILNHKPSWGCCYCMKKKKCTIENAKTLKKKRKSKRG